MTRTPIKLRQHPSRPHPHRPTTLLDLVWVLTQVTADTQQTVAVAARLINRGSVQLTGTFKNTRQIRV